VITKEQKKGFIAVKNTKIISYIAVYQHFRYANKAKT